MIYDERVYKGPVSAAEAREIRAKVRKNMENFLGHREVPLNESTVRTQGDAWNSMILADPEHYGEMLVEIAQFRRRYYEKYGPAQYINTPAYKIPAHISKRRV